MLDKNQLTEHVDDYAKRLATRDPGLSLDEVVSLNARRKELQKERDDLVHEARGLGPQIAQAKKTGADASAPLERSSAIKEQQKELDQSLKQAEEALARLAEPAAGGPGPLEGAERRQAVEVLDQILDQMDDDKRAVFVMAELEGLTAPEIAEATETKLNTVYSRLRAARKIFEDGVKRHRARDERRRA